MTAQDRERRFASPVERDPTRAEVHRFLHLKVGVLMKAARREAADIHAAGIFLHSIHEVCRVLKGVVLTDCDRRGFGLDHAEHQKV